MIWRGGRRRLSQIKRISPGGYNPGDLSHSLICELVGLVRFIANSNRPKTDPN
jgi:hypothetical protein